VRKVDRSAITGAAFLRRLELVVFEEGIGAGEYRAAGEELLAAAAGPDWVIFDGGVRVQFDYRPGGFRVEVG
jgi:hypothetical protein